MLEVEAEPCPLRDEDPEARLGRDVVVVLVVVVEGEGILLDVRGCQHGTDWEAASSLEPPRLGVGHPRRLVDSVSIGISVRPARLVAGIGHAPIAHPRLWMLVGILLGPEVGRQGLGKLALREAAVAVPVELGEQAHRIIDQGARRRAGGRSLPHRRAIGGHHHQSWSQLPRSVLAG